jgi:hypothetical protein
MLQTVFVLMLAATVGAPALAQVQAPTQLTPDQKGYIVYDQCMMHAAIKASHSEAKEEDIFDLVKAQCAPTRSAVTVGQETKGEFLAALDAADADKSAKFPVWIKGVRERRKAFEAQGTAPAAASTKGVER